MSSTDIVKIGKLNLTKIAKLIKKGDRVLYGKNSKGQHVVSNGTFVAITSRDLPKSLINKLEKEIEIDKVKDGYILNNFMHVGNIDKKDFDFTKLTKNGVQSFKDFMDNVHDALDLDAQNKEPIVNTGLLMEKLVQGKNIIAKVFYLPKSKEFMYFNKDYIDVVQVHEYYFTENVDGTCSSDTMHVSSPFKGIVFESMMKDETFIALPLRLEGSPFLKEIQY